jgi:hypothetical protein
MKLLRVLMNAVVYQCAWFACVLSAAAHRPFVGIAAAIGAVLLHLYLAPSPRRELPLIALAILAGVLFESLLVASGWVRASPAFLVGGVLPLWMAALWAAFATTLNVSLRALRHRYLLTALVAAVGAPMAYAAGAAMGAIQWVEPIPALLLIALGWAVVLPLLMRTALRFDGFATP